jgi:hypothetical protein
MDLLVVPQSLLLIAKVFLLDGQVVVANAEQIYFDFESLPSFLWKGPHLIFKFLRRRISNA